MPTRFASWMPPLLCLLAAVCETAQATQADPATELGLETCELTVPGTPLSVVGECGWLEVAENPDDPDGRRIDIHVARIPARGRVVEADPLVFFAGGPGQAATESWPLVAQALRKVNESRDILLVDQRGTGQSNPLKCPEIELDEALAQDWGELARTTRECLESVDGDPRFYTTTIAMHDIDRARAALGYEQVNLFGGSYGTRAAQVYLRLFPERVRTMVLDGVVPQTLILGTEHAAKLDQTLGRVLTACDADPDCGEAFPGTSDKLAELARRLEDTPVDVTVEHPSTGEPVTLSYDREVLLLRHAGHAAAADPRSLAGSAIRPAGQPDADRRDGSAAEHFTGHGDVRDVRRRLPPVPRRVRHRGLPDGRHDSQGRGHPVQQGPVPEGFHDPVTADVPVLLLSGELDPVTPPEYGDAVAVHFRRATHLVGPGQGHIVTTRGCMGELVSEFIAAGDFGEVDTDCMARMQRTPYFLSLTGPTP